MPRQETDLISTEVDIVDGKLRIEVVIKDQEVFPLPDFGDKVMAAQITDMLAASIKSILLTAGRSQQGRNRSIRMIPVMCKGCGKTFPAEAPCGGCKGKNKAKCTHCGYENIY